MNPSESPAAGYGNLLPNPPPLTASDVEGWLFVGLTFGLILFVVLPWAIRRATRDGEYLPLFALGAGSLCCLGEPMYDLVGHVRWAQNLPGPAFHNFGIDIPLMIPPSYSIFMGLEAYWIWTIIQRGVDRRSFMLLYLAIAASDAIFEYPGVTMGVWEYYGSQPMEFYKFPFLWAAINGAGICTIGVLLHFVWDAVEGRGWQRVAVLPVGLVGFTAGMVSTGMPAFLAMNADIPDWLVWALGSLSFPLALAWVYGLASAVQSDTPVRWTFWGLLRSRGMLPAQRARYIQGVGTSTTAATHAEAAPRDPVGPSAA